jgi:hypothetical protein
MAGEPALKAAAADAFTAAAQMIKKQGYKFKRSFRSIEGGVV